MSLFATNTGFSCIKANVQRRKKLISARHRKVCLTFALTEKKIKKALHPVATWVNRTGNFFHQNNNTPFTLLRQPVAQLTKFLCFTFLVGFDRSRYLLKMCTSFYKFQMMMGMKLTSLKEYPRDGGKH